ncbi:MAG: lipoyl synthase [Candidatus Omnitrophica bacterium]|nr:lipoyl synthase [Candidatus Omnitrophota bacterium]
MLKANSNYRSTRFPSWLRQAVRSDPEIEATKKLISELRLNTVCQGSRCPNIYSCFSKKKCTFLILGRYCARNCRFCCIENNKKTFQPPDRDELLRIKEAVKRLGARKIVITSVTRDDLEDGGAGHFADCINILRETNHELKIEVLVPDFQGRAESVETVIAARPDIFSHNVETVPRLYTDVRPMSDYKRSLSVIHNAKKKARGADIKSGFMVGLGETEAEVYSVMEDLRRSGCDIVTIGQYLRPDSKCLEVKEFVTPEKFERFSEQARKLGFKEYSSSPFTRSSYI